MSMSNDDTEAKTADEANENAKVEIPEEEVKIVVEDAPVVEAVSEEEAGFVATIPTSLEDWKPKTKLGKDVKSGKVTSINEILSTGTPILEPQITEILLPNMENDLLMVGQSKGKFGGGQKRAFRQTQKKTPEGNKPSFSALVVVGNKNGIVGVGYGKSKDTIPARDEAIRNAKAGIFKIRRGCGSWECNCKASHSIPFKVKGKVGGVTLELLPAPRGKGLIVEPEIAKILSFAGVKDIWCKRVGRSTGKSNLIAAGLKALHKLSTTKISQEHRENLGIVEGAHD